MQSASRGNAGSLKTNPEEEKVKEAEPEDDEEEEAEDEEELDDGAEEEGEEEEGEGDEEEDGERDGAVEKRGKQEEEKKKKKKGGEMSSDEERVDTREGRVVDAGWKGFCTAFISIMSRSLKDGAAPVLSETQVESKIREKKAEMKEKKLLAAQNKGVKDQGHNAPDITKNGFEIQLRKLATQGVVRLFNTVKEFQSGGRHDDDIKKAMSKANVSRRGTKAAKVAKVAFDELWEKHGSKKRKGGDAKTREGSVGIDQLDEFDG